MPTTPPTPANPSRRFFCQHCGKDSLAVAKPEFEGWTQTVRWRCAFCGVEIPAEQLAAKTEARSPSDTAPVERQRKAAAAFLGEELPPPPRFATDPTDGRFCKYCRHFLVHPFQCRCQLWKRPVDDPMQDCPRFEKKS